MLETVEAVRFIKELESGRNCPWLIEAERSNGDVIEVVAKLGSSECGWGGLVREAYSAMLAADLQLPTSEPFVVTLSAEFIETLPSPAHKARCGTPSTCFGCRYVPGMLSVQPGANLPSHLMDDAGYAFCFDAGVLNSDRLVTKPNCLIGTDGKSLLLIDHELSLNVHGRGFLVQDPWSAGALARMTMPPATHLFYEVLKPKPPQMDALFDKLAAIVPARVNEYYAAIPSEWDVDDVAEGIRVFLSDLVSNVPGLTTQVKAILP